MDHVDRILEQWNRERPDLDVAPMGLLGRIARLRTHLAREIEKALAVHGLNSASFDVLATLRRSGPAHQLSPGDLIATTMVSSGTMTNRLDQLEKVGLIDRSHNPEDRRGIIITLTPKGMALVDEALSAHVENQHRLLDGLSVEERIALDGLLRKFLGLFE